MTIKIKDMRKVLIDYQQYLPGWTILNSNVLFREEGPVLQGILFDRSTQDIYRPTSFIRVLCAPNSSKGMQMAERLKHLNGAPDRSVRLKNHSIELMEISKEILRQFEPDIHKPLEPKNVADWFVQKAVPTISQTVSLAFLYAYLGFLTEAKDWCDRFKAISREIKPSLNNIDPLHEPFIEALIRWIDNEDVRIHLDGIIKLEKNKLGIK